MMHYVLLRCPPFIYVNDDLYNDYVPSNQQDLFRQSGNFFFAGQVDAIACNGGCEHKVRKHEFSPGVFTSIFNRIVLLVLKLEILQVVVVIDCTGRRNTELVSSSSSSSSQSISIFWTPLSDNVDNLCIWFIYSSILHNHSTKKTIPTLPSTGTGTSYLSRTRLSWCEFQVDKP